MGLWPVYLWGPVYEDRGELFAVGDVVAWDVVMVDGEVEGWPSVRLVDTTVRIEPPPMSAARGSLAVAPELSACWRGDEHVKSVFWIKAGLIADCFNPPFRSTVTGTIRSIEVVARRSAMDEMSMWRPIGPWRLTNVRQTPRRIVRAGAEAPGVEEEDGLLADVEVVSWVIGPFESRGTEP